MKSSGRLRSSWIALAVAGVALSSGAPGGAASAASMDFAARQAGAEKAFREGVKPFVESYCSGCHGQRRQKGGINFEPALKNPAEAASIDRWRQALASVRTHDMPPQDADKQPTDVERRKFQESIAQIKYLSPKDPGPFVIRRLTKVEYGNTLRDLFGVDASVADALPDEVFGEGYLNSLSPMQSEQHLGIANTVLDAILAPEGGPPTAVQMRLLGQTPSRAGDMPAAARKTARSLARMAYRRPASELEVDVLMEVFELGRANGLSYPASLGLMLKAILVSPQFLFITPTAEAKPAGAIVPLDDHQLASRLSYFLWATMPDAELSRLADAGTLHEPEVLRGQVARLLRDARSRALFDGFGAQWLGVAHLAGKTFDPEKFPQMTPEMRTAMYEEARQFFESIVRENRGVVRFVDADYTYLNGTLAPLYGLEKSVTGPQMRKVTLVDGNRGGILAMPGVLATTSFPNRTSPVRRGVWVLEQVLGEHVPPPPPAVPALEEQDRKMVEGLTLRQRTELHQTNPVCANCHRVLDPIGFGLENFDAIGRWRDRDDSGGAIDAAGVLPDGQSFASPKALKRIVAARTEDLARNLTSRLLAYALCRQLEGYDEVVVEQLLERIAKDGYPMHSLIIEIATSYPFTERRVRELETAKADEKKPAN